MAQPRTKQVDLKDRKFELRRLSPEVGTFILMRMMGVQMRSEAAQEERAPAKPAAVAEPAVKPPEISGEARVRALSFIVFSGEWTKDGQAVVDGVQLLMNLTTEVLVICFSDFFEQGSAV
jgi:negative regulator of replication initiation